LKYFYFFLFLAAVHYPLPASVSAGTDISLIEWQSSSGFGKAKLPFSTIRQWKQGPSDRPPGHLRVLVTLANNGDQSIEGSILRCAIIMRLVKYAKGGPAKAGQDTEGAWGVPFWIEERRVPKIKPGKSKEVAISHFDLQGYLKRLRGTGFWPDALKVRIMVEPRAGDTLEKTIPESVIPVIGN